MLASCARGPLPTPADTLLGLSSGDAPGIGGTHDVYSEVLPGDLPEARDQDLIAATATGTYKSVYFDFDTAFIRVSERPKLQAAAEYLKQYTDKDVLIEGYCDSRGTAEYNLGLGDRRANAVKRYLQQLGILVDRIQILSKGDLEAIPNGTAEQMAQDRRADLILLQ